MAAREVVRRAAAFDLMECDVPQENKEAMEKLLLCVGDEAEKQALLLGEPQVFFTAPEYRDWPLVLLRLPAVDQERLAELVTDAWRMRAPETLAAQFDPAGGLR